ncbi:MAG: hypothetical protein ACXWC9_06315 [Pseudobdellovibrionaceae bacterium]
MRLKDLFASFAMTPLLISGLACQALASENISSDLRVPQRLNRSEFGIGAEVSQLQFANTALTGYGFHFYYQFAYSPKWAIRPQLAQALGSGNTYLYTSMAGFISYAVTGSYEWGHQDIEMNGKSIASLYVPRASVWSVGAGLEQIFLNGAQSIYAAPGMAFFTSYSWQWGQRHFTTGIRYGTYKNNNNEIKGTIFNVSIPFEF